MAPAAQQVRSVTEQERRRLRAIRVRVQDLRRNHGEDIKTGAFVRVSIRELVNEMEYMLNLFEGKPTEGESVEADEDGSGALIETNDDV